MTRPLAVAMAQVAPLPVDAGLGAFEDQVRAIVRRFPGTTLIVFPELHLFGVKDDRTEEHRLRDAAEPLTGPRVRQLTELAADLGVWLIPGTVCERDAHGGFFNTAVVLSPSGQLVASYRKIFVWRPHEPYDAGDRFVVFDIPGTGRLGLSICYDAWFPEVSRHLAWMGAEAIVNLVKTTTADREQEIVLARANSIVNQVFTISVNCAGPTGTGRSLLVDPEGRPRVQSHGADDTVLTDVIDLDSVTLVRAHGTAGVNRVWDPFREGDRALELPLYDGRIDPASWAPAQGFDRQSPSPHPSEEER